MSGSAIQGFVALGTADSEPELGAPMPYRIMAGDPRFTIWNVEEASGGLFAGIWQATPGKWRIEYEEWEFCHILSGVSIITEDGGESRTVRAGDSFVLRPGFSGSWEVVETTRKEYVVRDQAAFTACG